MDLRSETLHQKTTKVHQSRLLLLLRNAKFPHIDHAEEHSLQHSTTPETPHEVQCKHGSEEEMDHYTEDCPEN